jgi:glycine/D-amino acid oxidase-like deaminating enzyme
MYDPLHHPCPGPNQPNPNSYWHSHTQTNWPTLSSKLPSQAEMVVIGAGYTGLNAALELAERYQQQVLVLEANDIGWGCSSRNAGFAMPSTGRLGYAAWAKQCGEPVARGIQREYAAAFERLERHLQACPQHLERQPGGYLKIAHSTRAVAMLRSQFAALHHSEPHTRWLDQAALAELIDSPQAHAALHFPHSFGLNPLLLASSVARQAVAAGVQLFSHCPVQQWHSLADGRQQLQTPLGSINANKVIVASNGYTPNHLHPSVHGRSLPVLSSVVVTRPLSAAERAASGLSGEHLVMDTRALKYYFRLLPDGRLLFGGRGAIRGADADKPHYAQHLLDALVSTFPQLAQLGHESPAYFWSGWVSVALDDYPRIYSPAQNVYSSMGYCGAGVTFSQLAGLRVAQLAMGEQLPELPFYQSPLPRFPLPQLRRLGQWAYYQWARWQHQ